MSFTPENFAVWAEIPVTDFDRAIAFYSTVFDTELQRVDGEENPMAMSQTADKTGVAGHLYPGKPAPEGTGSTIHFASPDSVEAALKRVEKAGGKVMSDVLSIPDGRFAYCLDPDGNSIGIFAR